MREETRITFRLLNGLRSHCEYRKWKKKNSRAIWESGFIMSHPYHVEGVGDQNVDYAERSGAEIWNWWSLMVAIPSGFEMAPLNDQLWNFWESYLWGEERKIRQKSKESRTLVKGENRFKRKACSKHASVNSRSERKGKMWNYTTRRPGSKEPQNMACSELRINMLWDSPTELGTGLSM